MTPRWCRINRAYCTCSLRCDDYDALDDMEKEAPEGGPDSWDDNQTPPRGWPTEEGDA